MCSSHFLNFLILFEIQQNIRDSPSRDEPTKIIHAKPGVYFIKALLTMHFLEGSPNQVLDLPLEGRQTIIPGPETPVFYDSN